MGLTKRFTNIFRAKANAALDAAEDPRQMLDYSYERQLEMLRDVKRGIVEVTAAKRRLQAQADESRGKLGRLDDQARQALQAGREDLARAALERKQIGVAQLSDFDRQISQLETEQQQLMTAEARLSAKVDAFRTRKEVVKAQYSAAKAQVRIGEAVTGISEEMADVGYTIQRAEDRTAQLQSRGAAIGELIDAGVLADPLESGSSFDRELAQIGASSAVDAELAQLKQQLAPPAPLKELESGQ